MNGTTEENIKRTDFIVSKAICGLHGFLTNAEIRSVVVDLWDLENIEPTPKRIASSLKRLGYKTWRTGSERGFFMGVANG